MVLREISGRISASGRSKAFYGIGSDMARPVPLGAQFRRAANAVALGRRLAAATPHVRLYYLK
jgi:hypothetical protein